MLSFCLLLSLASGNPVTGPLPPDVNLEAGCPGYGAPGNYLLLREGYAAMFSATYHDPIWSQEQLVGSRFAPPQRPRLKPDPFKADTDLPAGVGSSLSDYKKSGFDRGHMAPSADFRWPSVLDANDPDATQRESFFLSNIVPQFGYLNQHLWAALEKQTRSWAEKYGMVQVITGPVCRSAHPRTIGAGVAVPDEIFKIVVVWQGTDRLRSMAVEIPNGKPTQTLDKYTVTIGRVEADVHLSFFEDLPPEQKQELDAGTGPQLAVPSLKPTSTG